jgi:hypothetical protein
MIESYDRDVIKGACASTTEKHIVRVNKKRTFFK